jgi:hypothetical protein
MQVVGTNERDQTGQQEQSTDRDKLLQNPQLRRNRKGGQE